MSATDLGDRSYEVVDAKLARSAKVGVVLQSYVRGVILSRR